MLVLSRKVNQQIRLGDSITVTVLRVQGNSIRIGIEAPRDVRVVRGELEPKPAESVDQPASSIDATDVLPPWLPNGGMLEFEVDGLDAEAFEPAPESSEEIPRIYQMRTKVSSRKAEDADGEKTNANNTKAPLARFFPPTVGETTNTYTV